MFLPSPASSCLLICLATWACLPSTPHAFTTPKPTTSKTNVSPASQQHHDDDDEMEGTMSIKNQRRNFLVTSAANVAAVAFVNTGIPSNRPAWAAGDLPDSLDVDNFLKYGQVQNPMGVSGQAGKSRPETGVFLRDGTEIRADSRSGSVLAEIVVGTTKSDPVAVLTSFVCPWPLATGTVFDVECRDANTGDGAFLTVTGDAGGKSISDLPSSFFLERLFSPVGRFSFYGSPTDVKVKKSIVDGKYRSLEVTFSTLSQSTQTEIPRTAVISATIPQGTDQAVMLVGSATSSRWRKGAESKVRATVESFRADLSPKTKFKPRPRDRSNLNVGGLDSF